jgi:hypothetical protein
MRSRQLGAHREPTVVTEGGDVATPTEGGASPGAPTLIDARRERRPQSWRSTACMPQLLAGTSRSGTIWGLHVVHGDERSARLCMSRTAATGHTLAVTSGNALPLLTGPSVRTLWSTVRVATHVARHRTSGGNRARRQIVRCSRAIPRCGSAARFAGSGGVAPALI